MRIPHATDQTDHSAPADPAWTDGGLDQRIIDSCVADKADASLFRELSARGINAASVYARARAIGLTREFVKECRLSESRPAMRSCIRCDSSFLSLGIHNRLCRRCVAR